LDDVVYFQDNQEEIELDMDTLDLLTLNKLWTFVKGNRKPRPTKPKPSLAQAAAAAGMVAGGDPAVQAARITELQRELARLDGRPDKMKKHKGGA
jgi:hypothetical protein